MSALNIRLGTWLNRYHNYIEVYKEKEADNLPLLVSLVLVDFLSFNHTNKYRSDNVSESCRSTS